MNGGNVGMAGGGGVHHMYKSATLNSEGGLGAIMASEKAGMGQHVNVMANHHKVNTIIRAQRLINLEIPVLVRSLKSSKGDWSKCCLSASANL